MVVEVYQRRLRPKMSIFNWIVIELPDPTRCFGSAGFDEGHHGVGKSVTIML